MQPTSEAQTTDGKDSHRSPMKRLFDQNTVMSEDPSVNPRCSPSALGHAIPLVQHQQSTASNIGTAYSVSLLEGSQNVGIGSAAVASRVQGLDMWPLESCDNVVVVRVLAARGRPRSTYGAETRVRGFLWRLK